MTIAPLVPWPVLAVVAVATAALAVLRWRRRPAHGAVVRSTAMVALVLVIALDPAVGGGHVDARASNLDVLFMVDTTGSVAAQDYDGDQPRLVGVRADVLDIAEQLAGARFAMITFDSVARLDLPWTTDYGALSASTDVIRQERTYNSLGSRLDVGLDMAESTLRRAKQADSRRRQLVFFFSDGEQTNPLEARSFRRLRGAVAGGAVFGYGTAVGGPMMRYTSAGYDFDSYIMDYQSGQPAISHIDEDNLRGVAGQLGVRYRHRTAPGGLQGVVSDIAASADSNVFDPRPGARRLYWIPALGIVALALWQIVAVVAELDDVRRMTRRTA